MSLLKGESFYKDKHKLKIESIDETKSGDYQSVEDSKLEEALKVEANKEDQKRDTMEDRLVDVIYKALKSLL